MSIIKEPKSTNFQTLFSNSKYEIPNLQRDFDWKRKELEKFWKDAIAIYNDDVEEYFLGPMVFVEEKTDEYQIIDGQQRFLTTSILAAAIRDILVKINNEESKSETTISINWINQLLYTNVGATGIGTEFRITPSELNARFYKDKIIPSGNYDEKTSITRPEDISNQKILDTYKFFITKLKEKWSESERREKLPDFIERIMKAFLVIIIKVDSIEKGHRVFETLNYRGQDLTVSSLIKNYLLEKSDDSELRENFSKWQNIAEILKNISLDDFLKHFWIAHYEVVTPSNLFDKFKVEIDSSQKVNSILDELTKNSEIYKQLRIPEKSYWYDDLEIVDYLGELNNISNDSAQPLLLNAKIFWDDKSKIKKMAEACSIIHFRAKTIGNKKPNEMVTKMAEIAKDIREKPHEFTVAEGIEKLSELDTSEPNFVSNFEDYAYSGKLASYVLKKIESFKQGQYTVTKICSKANLEHILPQSPNEDWEKDFDEESQKKYVSKIGNMTLLHEKLNRNAQNYSFEKKIEEYKEQPGIKITEELLDKKTWTKKQIDDRTVEFSEYAKDIWKLKK